MTQQKQSLAPLKARLTRSLTKRKKLRAKMEHWSSLTPEERKKLLSSMSASDTEINNARNALIARGVKTGELLDHYNRKKS